MNVLEPLDEQERSHLRRTIGLRCRRARLRLGLSKSELARLMDRSRSWVGEIERGDQYAPPYLIKALAAATGVSAGWLYGEDPTGLGDPAALPSLFLAMLQSLEPPQ